MTKTHDQGEYSPGPWNNARLELGEHAIPIQSRLESLTSGNRVRTSHEGYEWRAIRPQGLLDPSNQRVGDKSAKWIASARVLGLVDELSRPAAIVRLDK